MIDKKLEMLENEVNELNEKIERLEIVIIILMEKVDPEGFDRAFNTINDDDNVS